MAGAAYTPRVSEAPELLPAQRDAIEELWRRALRHQSRARKAIAAAGVSGLAFEQARRAMLKHARVTLNFHPQRRLPEGRSVAEALAEDGVYRAQFESGISNGSFSPDGARRRWESELFDGVYDESEAGARPKYGGWNLLGHADGAAPRFGAAHLRLRPEQLERCTFTWGDSHVGAVRVGTSEACDDLLAAMIDDWQKRGETLGVAFDDLDALFGRLTAGHSPALGRCLDHYVEAQVHGELRLDRDVEALVLDASLLARPEGEALRQAARTHGFAFETHPGYRLRPEALPQDFRGPRVCELAHALAAGRAWVDAATLAEAEDDAHAAPERWSSWGEAPARTQLFKQLWHGIVAWGEAGEVGEAG